MKIALYGTDMYAAASLAMVLKEMQGWAVEYYERVDDPELSVSNIVIADPFPIPTANWLSVFRRFNPAVALIIISASKDILSGSMGDPCYSMTKPANIKDIIDIIRFLSLGRTYTLGFEDKRKSH